MNKIYSLKYSHITGGLIAVSELSGRVSSRATGKKKTQTHTCIMFFRLITILIFFCVTDGYFKFLHP